MAKRKLVKVDTQQLAKGVFTPSDSEDAVTVVTPLEELTDKDKEDLQDFAMFSTCVRRRSRAQGAAAASSHTDLYLVRANG